MKLVRRIHLVGTLIFFAFAGAQQQAAAQGSVTVYGNLDLGIVKEGGSGARLGRGYNNWLGFKGQEELGSGLSAIFNIQARFNPDTGRQERTGTFWQGESTVGLKDASLGTLRLGRALSPLWQNVWAYEPWANSAFNGSLAAYQTGSYSSDGVNDAASDFADFSRISNGVYYSTPELGGLRIDVASAVEKLPDASARTAGLTLNFAKGPLAAMLSYERNAASDSIRFIGASYRLGAATLMGSFAQGRVASVGRERSIVVAGTYTIGAGLLRAGYGHNDASGNHKLSLGYVHSLSKRTRLYGDLYREHATDGRNGIALGINHTF